MLSDTSPLFLPEGNGTWVVKDFQAKSKKVANCFMTVKDGTQECNHLLNI